MTDPTQRAHTSTEALAALDRARPLPADVWALPSEALGIARAALEAAAQEQDDWTAIDAWTVEYKNRTFALTHLPMSDDESMAHCVMLTGRLLTQHFEAASRPEALAAAATFCRAELAK